MKRLIRLSALDMKKLEEDYLKMIEKENQSSSPSNKQTYKLTDKTEMNDDKKTFFPSSGLLIEYDDNQVDTNPRGGIPGPWAASLRWIGR
jgi:hypothetical protein